MSRQKAKMRKRRRGGPPRRLATMTPLERIRALGIIVRMLVSIADAVRAWL